MFLTNEVGEYLFLPRPDFDDLVGHRLSSAHPRYDDLKSLHFLDDSGTTLSLELLATKVRTKRSFLAGFTRLHLFVVTLRCDHSCPYCQVSRVTQDRSRFDMSPTTASRALDWVFSSPAPDLTIEFQGGEPTLNWPLVEEIVLSAERRAAIEWRSVTFVVASNLSAIDDEVLAFADAHQMLFSTSLDGPPHLHNANRPRPGRDSHERFETNLGRVRAALGHDRVSALMTTTPSSLSNPERIIDEYVRLGFDAIFLRPISPYGFAARSSLAITYDSAAFLDFYRRGLNYIIELNRSGTRLLEAYAQILLRKILTPFPVGYVDLQSPTGAAAGALVYNYDGGIYAADEGRMLAEMGDQSFRLGHVERDSYRDVMRGERVRTLLDNSCLESMPGCSDCAYSPYCGADPVFNWATQGDPVGFRPTSAFCARQLGTFRVLFDGLRGDDPFVRQLFLRWAAQGK
jgi:His-Xaa-Ser system radical SAM maturase HxsB